MSDPDALLSTWFADGPDAVREAWFRDDPVFDSMLRDRFGELAAAAARGDLGGLATSPRGALALLLLLDQLPRNLHRGSPLAFAADAMARDVARAAILRDRHDLALTTVERVFLYLPFEHAEDMASQNLSVALFEGLRDDARHAGPRGAIPFAWAHRAIVGRFGRFPHRNAVLGRPDAPGEAAFRAAYGRGF